jgi:hypothetical protein
MTCPKCHGANTQSAQMVCSLGTQHGSSIGVGFAHHGMAVGLAVNSSQTALAQSLAPGPEPPRGNDGNVAAGAFIAISLIMVLNAIQGSYGYGWVSIIVYMVPLIAVSAFTVRWAFRKQMRVHGQWAEKKKFFGTAWVCLQCGATWIPN